MRSRLYKARAACRYMGALDIDLQIAVGCPRKRSRQRISQTIKIAASYAEIETSRMHARLHE